MDDVLRAEQAHHEHARACLHAMRERTSALRSAGADRYADEATAVLLERRLASLFDDGRTPLFFGRLDYAGGHDLGQSAFHVGRCHVRDDGGRAVVVDWRAGVARPFYRASPEDRMGVVLRRRFGFAGGRVSSLETERLDTGEGADLPERALSREIERPRVGPMRDIVATIQPEQDDLIRAGAGETLCIQGSPGTGKTAVGLHRAAFLLYEQRERLARSGVLVVGPGPAFLSYIGRVLPGLGETNVTEVSLGDLVDFEAGADDDEETAVVKGGAAMATILRRAVRARVEPPVEPVMIRSHGQRFTLAADELRQLLADVLGQDLPYAAARDAFRDRLQRRFLRLAEQRGGSGGFDPQRDVARAMRASEDVRALLRRTWPPLDPATVLFRLLSDPEHLDACAGGLLDAEAQRRLLWARRPRSRRSAVWTRADLFLLDEVAGLLRRTQSWGHVVVDEAQDLSPMQLRAVGRRCRHGSATLLGDLAQATTPWAVRDWTEALAHLGHEHGRVVELPRAFRAPRSVLDFANRLLPMIGAAVTPARSVRDLPEALAFVAVPAQRLVAAAVDEARRALGGEGSVGVIVAPALAGDASRALEAAGVDHDLLRTFEEGRRLLVVPATSAKGLEFDHVVLVEPADIAAGRSGPSWLYIALTRAVARLVVVHSRPVPGA